MASTKYKPLAINDNEETISTNDTTLTNVNNSAKKICKYFTTKYIFSFLFFWVFVILLMYYLNFPNYSSTYGFKPLIYIFKNKSQTFPCNPFNTVNDDFYVNFDGLRYPSELTLHRNSSYNFTCINRNTKIKRIFLWTGFFSDPGFGYGLGERTPFVKNKCPVTNCEITNDIKLLNSSSLVLVHMRDQINPFPDFRPIGQRWIFVLYESPIHSSDFSQYNNLFNMTSTYRRDSDFPGFYETDSGLKWEINSSFNESEDFYQSKIDFAAIVVSNCGASNGRLEFVKQLQKYIKLDIFGKCGKPCPNRFRILNETGDCKDIIGKEYKFYLAFENSNCFDYITEKFHLILKYNIIPVVLGGGRYYFYIPKSGYINALDYNSPKKLADYLIYVANNSTLYNSFFKWKKYAKFHNNIVNFSPICDMCIQLQMEEYYGQINTNIIKNIEDYWNRNKYCYKPDLGI